MENRDFVLKDICEQKYGKLSDDIERLWKRIDEQETQLLDLIHKMNNNFNKIYYMLFALLGSIITTFITILLKR